MSHVTSQTAAALKAANFPQPMPKKGQKWQGPNGICCVLEGESDTLYFARLAANNHCLFIPTAEDILRELGMGWGVLVFSPPEEDSVCWCCIQVISIGVLSGPKFRSMAEAAAAAYLKLHAPK
jgi:hypothetical protein